MTQREIFSRNLKKLFAESGKQQIELAEYLRVSESNVTRWLHCTSYPRIDTLEKIARYFGVPVTYLQTERPGGMVTLDASPEEAEMIDLYRGATDDARDDAKMLLVRHQSKKEAMSSTSTSA